MKVILSLCDMYYKPKTARLSVSSLNTLSPARLYSGKQSAQLLFFLNTLADKEMLFSFCTAKTAAFRVVGQCLKDMASLI